jgi:hypothetical protein
MAKKVIWPPLKGQKQLQGNGFGLFGRGGFGHPQASQALRGGLAPQKPKPILVGKNFWSFGGGRTTPMAKEVDPPPHLAKGPIFFFFLKKKKINK